MKLGEGWLENYKLTQQNKGRVGYYLKQVEVESYNLL